MCCTSRGRADGCSFTRLLLGVLVDFLIFGIISSNVQHAGKQNILNFIIFLFACKLYLKAFKSLSIGKTIVMSLLNVLCEAAMYVAEQNGETPMEFDPSMEDGDDSGNENMALALRPRNRIEKSKHTEIEKKRRAYLRDCMENLKAVVPLDRDINRFTIQRLLVKAQQHITTLERRCHDYSRQYERCQQQHQQLKARLAELTRTNGHSPPSKAAAASALSLLSVARKEETSARVISRVLVTESNGGTYTTLLPGPHNRVTIQIQKIVTKTKKLSSLPPTPPPIVTDSDDITGLNANNTVPPLTSSTHNDFDYSRNV